MLGQKKYNLCECVGQFTSSSSSFFKGKKILFEEKEIETDGLMKIIDHQRQMCRIRK
jgi:hypothetical protein